MLETNDGARYRAPVTQTPGQKMLALGSEERRALWTQLAEAVARYESEVEDGPVMPRISAAALRDSLARFDFKTPRSAADVLTFAAAAMTAGQLHTAHPAYYGVFNPRPATLGAIADALVSALNPQLASWTSAPFAIEAEQHLVREFAALFRFPRDTAEGTFTHGGTEANHTALLTALVRRFPEFAKGGVRALPGLPVIYIATEGHHSFLKAARLCGLGTDAVREVAVDSSLRLDPKALRVAVAADRRAGNIPFFAVATAGTTGAGVVDPIAEIAGVAAEEKLWLHLDAAWGGPAILLDELADLFAGVERVDSLTLDTHKWLSIPMTAGLFLTRHAGVLEATFRVGRTHYMPTESARNEHHQPYAQSMGWSRRFLGLKVFLPLAAAGWPGYAATLRHQVRMGDVLREKLTAAGWRCVNRTKLPVVCFVDPKGGDHEAIAKRVGESGKSWVTTVDLSGVGPALRAGISNFATREEHLDTLIAALGPP